jgi:hypothetical protein
VVCPQNEGHDASLEPRKIYQETAGPKLPANMIRVIDESGEDYLYPVAWFEPIRLSIKMREALKLA